jgi:[1-hydroxy-2-(trimethylamino)ethyl]phosphonate dioxygenase
VSVTQDILALYQRRGPATYGEGVTQNEHALQAALLAEKSGAKPALIAAALLHDIGHLLHELPEDIAEQGVDTRHEALGSAWLSQHFGPEVSEPVRLHVAAKRYLCRVEPAYFDALSEASKLSLRLQGGPMSMEEAEAFAALPVALDAVQVRRWDDEAKRVGLQTPAFEYFIPYLGTVVRT